MNCNKRIYLITIIWTQIQGKTLEYVSINIFIIKNVKYVVYSNKYIHNVIIYNNNYILKNKIY